MSSRQKKVSRKQRLELQLKQTRNEAKAARLEAKAAEIELRIVQLQSGSNEGSRSSSDLSKSDLSKSETTAHVEAQPASEHFSKSPRAEFPVADSGNSHLRSPGRRELRAATPFVASSREAQRESPPDRLENASELNQGRLGQNAAARITHDDQEGRDPTLFASWDEVRQAMIRSSSVQAPSRQALVADSPAASVVEPASKKRRRKRRKRDTSAPSSPESGRRESDKVTALVSRSADSIEIAPSEPAAENEGKRRRPAALFASVVIHLAILLALALFSLSTSQPGDQVALSGSVAEAEEVAIESIHIETQQLSSPAETSVEQTLEISDVGELPIAEITPVVESDAFNPLNSELLSNESMTAAKMSLQSPSDATTHFCGVEGGGNHFVYLVDSSGSMGTAFESARAELLRAIDSLTPEQRFYVVFFDSQPDYMRLRSTEADEPRSVFATPENKALLRRWAMTIQMDRGKAPYDALPFALKLRPDAIFLLSDGEFPQRIEDLLKQANRYNNLFGDDGPVSIVHTIAYHSREGESRMQRIATQNGGQYRHVPKP